MVLLPLLLYEGGNLSGSLTFTVFTRSFGFLNHEIVQSHKCFHFRLHAELLAAKTLVKPTLKHFYIDSWPYDYIPLMYTQSDLQPF